MALCLFIANSLYYANKLPNIEIAAISKNSAHKSWFFKFLKKVWHKIHHIFDNEAVNKI